MLLLGLQRSRKWIMELSFSFLTEAMLWNSLNLWGRLFQHKAAMSTKSRNYKCKYTCSVEISPICREDLICLPPIAAHNLGNLGPFVICTKVTNSIALLDPFTLRHCYLDADQYWRSPFKAFFTSRQLVEYIVLDVKVASTEVKFAAQSMFWLVLK